MNKDELLNALHIEGAASLIVAKRTPAQFHGQHVPLNTEVETDLKTIAQEAVARLRQLEMRTYEPDLKVEPKNDFMFIPATMIANYENGETRVQIEPASAERLIDIDNSVVHELMNVATMTEISARDIQNAGYNMYAVIIGDDPDNRTIYIRHSNPQKFSKPGRLMTAFSDTLTRFEKPIFTFDEVFDIVITRHGLLVANQSTFERTFRDVQVLAARHSERVTKIAQALPLDEESQNVLAESALKPSIATKLRAISENGHLNGVTLTVEDIRLKAQACGVDPATLIQDGKLRLTQQNLLSSLKVLNDDVFKGAFTGQTYEAGSKAKRSQS
jgi:hypothetical protein